MRSDDRKISGNSTLYDYEIALIGNPNVGKSSLFNLVTGLKQHTGNWSGKTVSNSFGFYKHNGKMLKIVDLPGVYSLKADSKEEETANDYILSSRFSCAVIVVDSTNLERNLNLLVQVLKYTNKCVLCLNMWDEAEKNGIYIDTDELSLQFGIPVVKTSTIRKYGINKLFDTVLSVSNGSTKTYTITQIKNLIDVQYTDYVREIYQLATRVCNKCQYKPERNNQHLLDKILTSKFTGALALILILLVLFWITIVGANIISDMLSGLFSCVISIIRETLENWELNTRYISFLVDGILTTLCWVVAVMLPPMAIFFPIFAILEDSGILPRIAFNLDPFFKKGGCNGKQSLTMAMGLGCNSCGVMGCRIINSNNERNISIVTNSFVPCNGKLPSLIVISSIFIATTNNNFLNTVITSGVLVVLVLLSVAVTMVISKLLSKWLYKGKSSVFMMELPPYRKPRIMKTILYSLKNKAIYVLLRAVVVAIPAGAIIWLVANIRLQNITVLQFCTDILNPFGLILGLDGIIVMALILGFPANEIVIPIMLMAYTTSTSLIDYTGTAELSTILINNGWTLTTALCFLVVCLFHFPCATTCATIYKETGSVKTTMVSVLIPTLVGLSLSMLISLLF